MLTQEQRDSQVAPGVTLPNGWLCVLAQHVGPEQRDGVVLAENAANAHPYATWAVRWRKDAEGRWYPSTMHGEYVATLVEALESYRVRLAEQQAFFG